MKVLESGKAVQHYGDLIGKLVYRIVLTEKGNLDDEAIKQINEFQDSLPIVITGCDPLMNQVELLVLISSLKDKNDITIETSGNIMPDYHIRSVVKRWTVHLDSKLKSSDALFFFVQNAYVQFAYFVKENKDLKKLTKIILDFDSLLESPSRVFLVPSRTIHDDYEGSLRLCETACRVYGFSLGIPIFNLGEKR